MKKDFTPLQKSALADSMVNGELTRSVGHGNFTPGNHLGQTIASLVDQGYFEVTDKNHNGYPLTVRPTTKAIDCIGINF